jgi:hypothetical protein
VANRNRFLKAEDFRIHSQLQKPNTHHSTQNTTAAMNPSTTTSDPIEVRVLTQHNQVLRGIVTDMAVLVEIKTGAVSKTKRPSVDLAIVLVMLTRTLIKLKSLLFIVFLFLKDKSGSMSGTKLEQCKTAIVKVPFFLFCGANMPYLIAIHFRLLKILLLKIACI